MTPHPTPTSWLEALTESYWQASCILNGKPCGGALTFQTAIAHLQSLANNTLYPRLRLLAGSTLASRAPSDVSVA